MADWLNEQSLHILQTKYLQKGETYEQALQRIGKGIYTISKNKTLANSILQAIDSGWLGLASPIWANFGTDRGFGISCFSSYIDDSMIDIADKVKEVMMQTKMGGGTSGYFGALRPRGAEIKGNGTTNGAISFMKIFDSVIEVTSQGNVRRGSFAAYLDAEHPDILEFLNIRQVGNPIQNLLTGVCLSDKFMQSVVDGDSNNRKIWAKILESRMNTGTPYLFFTDNVNRSKPEIYKDEKIYNSNLCVYGDTEIYTDTGRVKIKDVCNQLVKVWNGEAFSPVEVKKTGEDQEMVKVITSKGHELVCTKYHKFYVKDETEPSGEREVRASELHNGMRLVNYQMPVINQTENIAWLNGVIKSSGEYVKGVAILLYSDSKETQQRWIKRIGELGVVASISKTQDGDKYRDVVIIGKSAFGFLSHLGLSCLKDEKSKAIRPIASDVDIERVEPYSGFHDSYCFTELKKGRAVFNGMLTGQCSEILLPSNKDESFVCCLSSLNLEKYDEWKDTDLVYNAIRFLDVVMEEFIIKSKGVSGFETAHNFAKRHRALGLGVLGFHSYLQSKHIAFGSEGSKKVNRIIFKKISEQAKDATRLLAKELGVCPIGKEKGIKVRNATTLAIAPTTNNSAILGQASPGIEPYKSNYYVAGLNDKSHIRKNKYLEELLERKNLNSNLIWDGIMSRKGSVQHLQWMSDEEKKVFATFAEIDQKHIIDLAIDRQEYLDQGQSVNLIIHYNTPIKEVNAMYIDAWKRGIKTLYYQRGVNIAKENIYECRSCQA